MPSITRKIQKTGRASYIVTLPKGWIRKNNLEKGSSIIYNLLPNGNLIISPADKLPIKTMLNIKIEKNWDSEKMFRNLLGAYTTGNSRILVKTDDRISAVIRDVINKFIDSIIGFKISKETETSILLEELTEPSKEELVNSLNRMTLLVNSMLKDVIVVLKKPSLEMIMSIIKRDEEINQLSRYLFHISTQVFDDFTKLQQLEFSIKEAQCYIIFSIKLENIGDNFVSIAKNIKKMIDEYPKKNFDKYINLLEEISLAIVDTLEKGIKSWNLKNLILAEQTFNNHKKVIKKSDELIEIITGEKSGVAMIMNNIIENFRRSSKIALNIGYLTIDFLVDRTI